MIPFAEIDWSRPVWLVGLTLAPVAVAVGLVLARRRRRAIDVFAEGSVRRRTQPRTTPRRGIRGGLLIAVLVGLVLALAGPRWGVERIADQPVEQQVVFALDVSRSMLARDAGLNRLQRSKLAIRQIVGSLPTAEVGLVVFAGEAALTVPLTRDAAALELYLGSVGPDWISDPSTDLANAVAVSVDAFGPLAGPGRAVVVFSDGEDQAGGAEGAAKLAGERGVRIFAVGVGTRAGARIPVEGGGWLTTDAGVVTTRLDTETLSTLASGTGGALTLLGPAGGGVNEIVDRLRALDAEGARGTGRVRRGDRYRWPLAVALIALMLEVVVRLHGRRRRPLPVEAVIVTLVLTMACGERPEAMYDDGRYADALEAWREADQSPGAEPEHAYNRGNAAYRMGVFREAAASHAVAARTVEESAPAGDAWYNAGNARFRIAEGAQSTAAEEGPRFWNSAVLAYRDALLQNPDDQDAKHNLELALQRQDEAGGGGGRGGDDGGGGGGESGNQPPSSGAGSSPQAMSRSEAERLLDALSARERDALVRGDDERRAGQVRNPGW